MIECICIDDKAKPRIIPSEKWVVKLNKYHITHVGTTIGGKILTVTLSEINLGKEFYPYEGFRMSRFAFKEEDLQKLFELMQSCSELSDVDLNELINQPQILEPCTN